MLRFVSVLATIFVSSSLRAQSDAGQARSAKAVLDAFHAKSPEPSSRKLHIVYFTPADKEPADNWQPRVQRTMEHIREFYAREMARNGFAAKPLPLDYDGDKKLVVHMVRGKLPFERYGLQSGNAIREESRPLLADKGIKIDQETIVIFCNLTTVDDKSVRHQSPYYAGGSAKGGTAWLCDSKYLDSALLDKLEPKLVDGQYGKVSLGKYNTIFVGGTAHELGHALGLPHNRENAADRPRGTSLMGSGNHTYGEELRGEGKGSFLPLVDALRLASHPFFSGSVKELKTPVKVMFHDWRFEPGEKDFVVKGRVESSLPCYAVIAYLDPEGGGDYDAHTATSSVAADGSFSLACKDLVKGKSSQLRVLACLVNGATQQKAFPYSVSKDGRPNLDDLRADLLLQPVIKAWKANDREAFDKAVDGVATGLKKDDGVLMWTTKLRETLGLPKYKSLDTVPADIKEVSLSDCGWSAAKVGWLAPARNHVPQESFFLSVAGERFARGLYGHAPSNYQWSLGGGWQSLAGKAGVQDGSTGSVVFAIKADGKELWRSPLVKAGRQVTYQVDVRDAKMLELIVEDGGDGNGSDWGVWLDPKLRR